MSDNDRSRDLTPPADVDRLRDLEGMWDHERAQHMRREAVELSRAERTALTLDDRLAGSRGQRLRIMLRSGRAFEGELVASGRGWCEILESSPALHVLVPSGAVAWAHGELLRARPEDPRSPRASLMRRLGRLGEGSGPVTVLVAGTDIQGRIVGVWDDHLDVLPLAGGQVTSPRSPVLPTAGSAGRSGAVISIPLAALDAVYAHRLLFRG